MPHLLRPLARRRVCFVAGVALLLSAFGSAAVGAQVASAPGARGAHPSSSPDKLDDTVAEAQAAQAAGQYAVAATAYARATTLDPSIPELWANRGLMSSAGICHSMVTHRKAVLSIEGAKRRSGDIADRTLTEASVQGYRSALLEAQGGTSEHGQQPGFFEASFTYPGGNAVQPVHLSATLLKGTHQVSMVRDSSVENAEFVHAVNPEAPVLLWEGPGISRQQLVITQQPKVN